MPAPCTRPITLRAKAGTISWSISEKSGRAKDGSALGTWVTSPTRGTFWNHGRKGSREAKTIARIKENWLVALILSRPMISTTVVRPTIRIGRMICWALRAVSTAWTTRLEYWL